MGFLTGGYSSNSTKSTSSTTPTLTAEYQPLRDSLLASLMARLTGGTDPNIEKRRIQSLDQVNQGYSGSVDRIMSNLASRGYGTSGQAGNLLSQAERARLSTVGNVNADFSGQQTQAQSDLVTKILQLLQFGMGSNSAGTGSQSGWNIGARFDLGNIGNRIAKLI